MSTDSNKHGSRSTGEGRFTMWLKGEFGGERRVGFWHDELSATRKQVSHEWIQTTLILCTAILTVLSIYWGSLLHVQDNVKKFDVIVVDFDNTETTAVNIPAFVGPTVVEAARRFQDQPESHPTFKILPASQFSNDPMNVREAIYDFHHWAAIIIHSNATTMLRDAVTSGNSSYDPKGACQTIVVTARDQVAFQYLTPALTKFQVLVTAAVGTAWAHQIANNLSTGINTTALSLAPQALAPAIGFTNIDLRPFAPATATPAVSVGLIYLIIIAFFSFTFFMPTHSHFVNEMEGHSRLYFHHIVFWKYTSAVGAYLLMSLAYSFVSLAFQIPFTAPPASHVEPANPATAYGHASFMVFWMINFIGMCALGLACENMAMILGMPWTALWLIFWVIVNVSTAFYPLELVPSFYQYGRAFPLHSIVEATRTVLFDLHSRMGKDMGILLAWWAVNTAVFPFAARYLRYQMLVKKKPPPKAPTPEAQDQTSTKKGYEVRETKAV